MRRVNNAAMRWAMQATRAPTRSQRASRVIAALPAIASTFVMHAMLGPQSRQLKMPLPDAYGQSTCHQTGQFYLLQTYPRGVLSRTRDSATFPCGPGERASCASALQHGDATSPWSV